MGKTNYESDRKEQKIHVLVDEVPVSTPRIRTLDASTLTHCPELYLCRLCKDIS